MNTENILLRQHEDVRVIVGNLIEASCWFQVEPWGADEWRITTKAEGHLLRAGCASDRIYGGVA